MKPSLLVTELWGLGDLAIASEFLRRACVHYSVRLIAKPPAIELGRLLWPEVEVIPFTAPWTRFRGKYQLHRWPWADMARLIGSLRKNPPSVAASARWDPRDHLLLFLSQASRRLGFPRTGSRLFLNDPLPPVERDSPRTAQWMALADRLELSPRPDPPPDLPPLGDAIVIHSGAAQPVRVWPLERYAGLANQLREQGWRVLIICDPSQQAQWELVGETPLCPDSPTRLIEGLLQGRRFIGNDSGPGHIAAALGCPTFTLFGPQRPEWFLPDHPQAGWIPGKPCDYKPCFDYCRMPRPHCLLDQSADEVLAAVLRWLDQWKRGS